MRGSAQLHLPRAFAQRRCRRCESWHMQEAERSFLCRERRRYDARLMFSFACMRVFARLWRVILPPCRRADAMPLSDESADGAQLRAAQRHRSRLCDFAADACATCRSYRITPLQQAKMCCVRASPTICCHPPAFDFRLPACPPLFIPSMTPRLRLLAFALFAYRQHVACHSSPLLPPSMLLCCCAP